MTTLHAQPVLHEPMLAETAAAAFLGLSVNTLRHKRAAGSGPRWVQLSDRRIGYRMADLVAWIERRTVDPRLVQSPRNAEMLTRPAGGGMLQR